MRKIILNKSIEKTSKIQAIEGTKKKFLIFLIILGAVFGSIAPFVHIVFPKVSPKITSLEKNYDEGKIDKSVYSVERKILKEKYKVFGFSNMRRFVYAIGLPIALLLCSLLFLVISQFIYDRLAILGTSIAASIFLFTSLYFVLWTMWPYDSGQDDFSETTYYWIMFLVSLAATVVVFLYTLSKSSYDLKISELVNLVVVTRKDLFQTLEKHESSEKVFEEKSRFDNTMYETFDKVSK